MSNEAKPWKDPITDEDLDLWIRCWPEDYMARQLRAERARLDRMRNLLFEVWSYPVAVEHLPVELEQQIRAALKDTAP